MPLSQNKTVYMLFGPTGSGKSDVVSKIACKKPISLISADSIQVYKGLDIGSAKPSKIERSRYPHYLIDIKESNETFTVAEFIELAQIAIEDSFSKGRTPIISGGTAFYFKNFLYGLSQAPKSDLGIRKSVADEASKKGLAYMYDHLRQIDPISANRINPNDKYRILRAIEVFRASSKPLSSFQVPTKMRDDYDFVIIGLRRDKEELKKRIRYRLDNMIKEGLEDEVRSLMDKGLTLDNQSMRGIGYREFFLPLSRDEIIEQIYTDTVHYAKRQMTFFSSLPRVKWINFD